MDLDSCSVFRRLLVVALLVSGICGPVAADDWLVYLGGGLEPIEGGWNHSQGRVVFRKVGGTLVSVPFADVDLPTSAFVTWQLNGRLEAPPRASVPVTGEAPGGVEEVLCSKGQVVSVVDGETLRVQVGDEVETVHVACLDTPDTRHRFTELSWFGRTALDAVAVEFGKNPGVCLAELPSPQRDQEGHRIVYVLMGNGKDYAAEVIAAGFGLQRLGPCERAGAYRALESRAIADERGLWGAKSEKMALTVASNTVAIGTSEVSRAGGSSAVSGARDAGRARGSGAPPPRRIGGG